MQEMLQRLNAKSLVFLFPKSKLTGSDPLRNLRKWHQGLPPPSLLRGQRLKAMRGLFRCSRSNSNFSAALESPQTQTAKADGEKGGVCVGGGDLGKW